MYVVARIYLVCQDIYQRPLTFHYIQEIISFQDHKALVKGRDDLINVLAKDFEISGLLFN